jgi:hypothetical protein
VSRREQIKMSGAEVAAFLAEERTVTCATVGSQGWPHLMPLWYVLRKVSRKPTPPTRLSPPISLSPPAPENPPISLSPPAPENPPTSLSPPTPENSPTTLSPPAPENPPAPRLWAWTYGASQKVVNLERDPRATLQVEAAEAYHELRGVMLECEVLIHRELELVSELGGEILLRNSVPRGEQPPAELPLEVRKVVAAQAVKRVGLEFVERRRTTWDHRKLGGLY